MYISYSKFKLSEKNIQMNNDCYCTIQFKALCYKNALMGIAPKS